MLKYPQKKGLCEVIDEHLAPEPMAQARQVGMFTNVYYTLGNVYISIKHDPAMNGKTHGFDWAMASSSQTVRNYQR